MQRGKSGPTMWGSHEFGARIFFQLMPPSLWKIAEKNVAESGHTIATLSSLRSTCTGKQKRVHFLVPQKLAVTPWRHLNASQLAAVREACSRGHARGVAGPFRIGI